MATSWSPSISVRKNRERHRSDSCSTSDDRHRAEQQQRVGLQVAVTMKARTIPIQASGTRTCRRLRSPAAYEMLFVQWTSKSSVLLPVRTTRCQT